MRTNFDEDEEFEEEESLWARHTRHIRELEDA